MVVSAVSAPQVLNVKQKTLQRVCTARPVNCYYSTLSRSEIYNDHCIGQTFGSPPAKPGDYLTD